MFPRSFVPFFSGLQQYISFGPIQCRPYLEHVLHHTRTSPCESTLLSVPCPLICALLHLLSLEFNSHSHPPWALTPSWYFHLLAPLAYQPHLLVAAHQLRTMFLSFHLLTQCSFRFGVVLHNRSTPPPSNEKLAADGNAA